MPYGQRKCLRCKITPQKGGKFYVDNNINRYRKNIVNYCKPCVKANYECNNCHQILKCQNYNANNPNTCKVCVKQLRLEKDKRIKRENDENPKIVRKIVNSIQFFVTEIILQYAGTHTQKCKKCKKDLEIKEYKVNKKGNIGKTCIKCLGNKKIERQEKLEEWRRRWAY